MPMNKRARPHKPKRRQIGAAPQIEDMITHARGNLSCRVVSTRTTGRRGE
jgi:hypothetical protein